MSKTVGVVLGLVATLALAGVARADFCIQIDGQFCALSGDLGFFRFKGGLPKGANKIKTLRGRVAGLSPAFGTAVVFPDKSLVELGVTFFADAVQGQFDVQLFQPNYTSGIGFADYGTYDVNTSCNVQVVSCQLEP